MRNRLTSYALILAAMCWSLGVLGRVPGDAHAAPAFLPDCVGKAVIANTKLNRVESDGTLILSGELPVRLEGIRLPLDGPHDIGERAIGRLQEMAGAEPVTLAAPPGLDRYGRVRAQAFGSGWLQISMLEQGLARVQISPDRQECAPDLYEAEARARTKGAGLWALERYRVRTPEQVRGTAGTFQLVEGMVNHIGQADGRTFIDFGTGERRVFSIVIAAQDRRAFRNFDFDELSGRHIRVRGIVQDYRGRPEIALSNPYQLEVLD